MKNQQPAFPHLAASSHHPGLTKREYMAALIMASMLGDPSRDATPESHAKHACRCADALIEALRAPA